MPGPLETRLTAERLANLFHFTSIENLPGIAAQAALCSKQFLADRGLNATVAGGNALSQSLDGYHGNADFVNLYFTPYTPMAYWRKRTTHLCWFVLKPSVADIPGVEITDCNAAATGHQQRGGVAGLELLDFTVLRSTPQPGSAKWMKHVQAELLVPTKIPTDFVQEVAFVSRASLEEGGRLWGGAPHPPFVVRPSLFSDFPGGAVESIAFAHVETALLTSEIVTAENALELRVHQGEFQRTPTGIVQVVASVRATAGSKAEVSIGNGRALQSTKFGQTRRFIYYPRVRHADLPNVEQGITINLDGIRWVTIPCRLTP